MKKTPLILPWVETLVPILPILCQLVSLNSGLTVACSGAVIFFVLASAARFLGLILNQNQISFLFVAAAATSVYVLNVFYPLPASLVLTLCLMGPAGELKKKYKPKISVIILKAVLFFLLTGYLTLSQEFLGGVFHWSLFQRVSGTLLLLIPLAFFWPSSRRTKGKVLRKGVFLQEVPVL